MKRKISELDFNKKNVLFLAASVMLLIATYLLTSGISLFYNRYLTSGLSIQQIDNLYKQSQLQTSILNLILYWFSSITAIFAGALAAWNAKKNEWLYGALSGVVYQLLFFIASIWGLIRLIDSHSEKSLFIAQNIVIVISKIPSVIISTTVFATLIGGGIVSLMHERSSRR